MILATFSPSVASALALATRVRCIVLGLGTADLAVAFLLGDLDLGLVDGPGRGLTAERIDVAGLVGDVLDVDVDQVQADLAELDLERIR